MAGRQGRGEDRASPRRIAAAERAANALRLRKAGVTYEMIASTLGYSSRQAAHRAVMRALDRTIQEPAEDLRKLELERLAELQRVLWPKALEADTRSVDRVLAIMERRARLLGLDAPVRAEVTETFTTRFDEEIDALAERMQSLDQQAQAGG